MNVRKIFQFSLGPVGSAILGLAILPVLTWFFSAEDIGRLAIFQTVVSFSNFFFSFGLDQSYVREYYETRDKFELFRTAISPGLICQCLLIFVVLIYSKDLSFLIFGLNQSSLIYFLFLSSCAAFLSNFLYLILRLEEKAYSYSFSQIVSKMALFLFLGASILFCNTLNSAILFLVNLLSALSLLVVLVYTNREFLLNVFERKFNKKVFFMMTSYSFPLMFSCMVYWGLISVDKMILRSLSNFGDLGFYSVATTLASAGLILQNIFSTIWAPAVYRLIANGDDEGKVELVQSYVMFSVACIFILAGIFSWIIPYLLPKEYFKVQDILVACLSYPLFLTLSEATVIGIGITKKTIYLLISVVIAFLVVVGCNFILVPKYGASGAAISTAIAFFIFMILRTEFSSRVWKSFPRVKIYILSLSCLVAAIFQVFSGGDYFKILIVWLLISVLTIYMYRDIAKNILKFFFVKSRNGKS